jgi:hypothetical protein
MMMARRPNYEFEKRERERQRAEKKAARAAAKQEAKKQKAGQPEQSDGETTSPPSQDQ